MPAVNWDQPSNGVVNHVDPALTLTNDTGGALVADSVGTAVDAESKKGSAVVAKTNNTLTGLFVSVQSMAVAAIAPKAIAVAGANRTNNAAVVGGSVADPTLPVVQSPQGIGVLDATNRFQAIGAAGVAFGPRSLGVLGQAASGVGVRGLGTEQGVEGAASSGHGVAGYTQSGAAAGVYGFGPGDKGAGVRGQAIVGAGVDARPDQAWMRIPRQARPSAH